LDGGFSVEPKADWLSVAAPQITNDDFNDEDMAQVKVVFRPSLLESDSDSCELMFQTGTQSDMQNASKIPVSIRRKPVFTASLLRESLRHDETGHIIVENNTGEELSLDIDNDDTFIRFDGKRLTLEKEMTIPFHIKIPGFGAIRKQPYIKLRIRLLVFYQGKPVVRSVYPIIRLAQD
jgi:hypothetical protein